MRYNAISLWTDPEYEDYSYSLSCEDAELVSQYDDSDEDPQDTLIKQIEQCPCVEPGIDSVAILSEN
jgi:hypothetical protein